MKLAIILLASISTAHAASPCDKHPDDFFLYDTTPQAKDVGIDYPGELTAAFQKNNVALGNLFEASIHLDGSGAQSHAGVLFSLLRCWGDAPFAAVLKTKPKIVCGRVLEHLDYETEETEGYKNDFPITHALSKMCL